MANQHIDRSNYENDPRVRAASTMKPWILLREDRYSGVFRLNDLVLECLIQDEVPVREDGEYTLNITRVICSLCRGYGKVVNPSIDCNGLTQEEFDQEPGFEENYNAGMYDITCPQCKGKSIEITPIPPQELKKPIANWVQENYECEAQARQERIMGY